MDLWCTVITKHDYAFIFSVDFLPHSINYIGRMKYVRKYKIRSEGNCTGQLAQ